MRQNYNLWSQNEILQLKELVSTGKFSFREIGKKLNRSLNSCQGKASAFGYKNSFIQRKYNVNENFFEIPNKLNCFWAGFGSADSCLKPVGQTFVYITELSRIDENFLLTFKNDINYEGKIRYRTRIINEKKLDFVLLEISSEKIGKDLINNFNLTPNKSKRLQPPNIINNELLLYWLKGYICGDGTIFYHKLNNSLVINFVSASKDIIEFVKKLIDSNFNYYYRKKENLIKNYNTYYHYSVGGIRACFLFDYLRKLDTPKMDRKWEQPIVIEYVKTQIEKYNNLQLTKQQI